MLSALRETLLLSLAGQTSTHSWQPVQSSTATWIVYNLSGNSRHFAGIDLNPAGASVRSVTEQTFARIVECGQTITHLPHSIHKSGSQTGTSCAMFRFSQRVVPTGYVPSAGKALTGKLSPRPALISAVTLRTNSGASRGTFDLRSSVLFAVVGTSISRR